MLEEGGGRLTYAGALLADACPVYNSRIFCTRWNGLEKGSIFVDALDDSEYSGNMISLLQNGLNFIRNNYKVKWRKTPEKRVEMPDYPQTAIREALVNAIIHRDYSFMGSEIHIDIYDDRLEITSPGGMVDGKRIQNMDIMKVPSKRRNPVIADLFQRLKLVERRGSGLEKIRKEYESTGRQPVFFSDDSWFITTLYNLNYGMEEDANVTKDVTINVTKDVTKGKSRHDQLMELIATDGALTSAQLSQTMNVTKRTVLRDLEELKNAGIITRVGGKRFGHWEIVNGENEGKPISRSRKENE
ncbi:MAG: DeoR family transcriptional regulator [Synergistaceae bacterium]|nr:DeoR family transcriptional regulator [Synergistaceae bacterium]